MTAGVVTTLDEVLEGTDLAITWPDGGRAERWVWRDQKMFKHGETRGVEPFFFTGLIAQGKVVHGDFAPPQVGEWFIYNRGRQEAYRFYVANVTAEKVDLIYFVRGEYSGWTVAETDRVFDEYQRLSEPMTITPAMFQSVVHSAHEAKALAESRQQQVRNTRDSVANMRYARDYLNIALETAERRTT